MAIKEIGKLRIEIMLHFIPPVIIDTNLIENPK